MDSNAGELEGQRHGALDALLASDETGPLGSLQEDALACSGALAQRAALPTTTSKRPPDPWAHRRGEPRVFALFWAVYLLGSAAATVFAVREFGFLDSSTFRPAVRALLVLTALGVCALWPMVRLSQAPPRSPVAASIADCVVILIPAQGVLWPMVWLANWPWEIGAGLAALFTAWTLFVGAVLALSTSGTGILARTVWMLIVLAVTAGAPTLLVISSFLRNRQVPDETLLASAYTAVIVLTSAPSGLTPKMTTLEWIASSAPAVLAIPVWALASLRKPSLSAQTIEQKC